MNTFIWLYLLLVDLGYIPRTTNEQFCALMDKDTQICLKPVFSVSRLIAIWSIRLE